jgi:hypothetical protein
MARIEWVKHRLNNWALWVDQEQSGGRGYASQSSFLNQPGGGSFECRVPVDDVDASVTNTAVESLKLPRPHLYQTLHCIYPHGLGIKETARQCGAAESTIKSHLDQADAVLALWFNERAEGKRNLSAT